MVFFVIINLADAYIRLVKNDKRSLCYGNENEIKQRRIKRQNFWLLDWQKSWRRNPLYLDMDVRLPEGWTADYSKTVFAIHDSIKGRGEGFWEMTIHVGENVEAINRIPVIVWARGNATPVFIPIVLLG